MSETRRRSEEVRARRASRNMADKKPKASKQRDRAMPTMPAMVSRRGVIMAPVQARTREEVRGGILPKNKNKNTRRRFDIAMPGVGAELRLPAIPQVQFGWRLMSFFMVIGLAWSIFIVWTAPRFQVQSLEIEGVVRIPDYELEAIVDVVGQPIFMIDPASSLERLQAAFPELQNVSIEIGYPAVVRIVGAERTPVVEWNQHGVIYWLDAEGYRFLPRGEADLIHVEAQALPPQVPAPRVTDGEEVVVDEYLFTTPAMIEAVITLSSYAPEGAALLYHPAHGLGWVDENHGWKVYFGPNPTDMQTRLIIYDALIAEFAERNMQPEMINLEHLHAPYYRMFDNE